MRVMVKTRRLLLLAPVVVAAIAVAGCEISFPLGAQVTGGGTWRAVAQGPVALPSPNGSIQLNYQLTNPSTGGGTMSGNYFDPGNTGVGAGGFIKQANSFVGNNVSLEFNKATSDICYSETSLPGGGGLTCGQEAYLFCSIVSGRSFQTCLDYMAALGSACASAAFNYTSTNSSHPGTGIGTLVACGTPTAGGSLSQKPSLRDLLGSGGSFVIHVTTGPYANYTYGNQLSFGSFTVSGEEPLTTPNVVSTSSTTTSAPSSSPASGVSSKIG